MLPEFPARDLLLTTTYVVVVFSILVQGLTVGPLVRRLFAAPGQNPESSPPDRPGDDRAA